MFLSKLIKEKYLGYTLSILTCIFCFQIFWENYPYAVKVNNFDPGGQNHVSDPLDQTRLIGF